MSARSRSSRLRGVTLSEALVSLLILTMVMIVALTLLFTMKSFAERQQAKTAPRQTARRAVDYLSTFIAGATDLNDDATPPNPNAIVTWYSVPGAGGPAVKQASFNNLPVGSALGEPGTDILTIALPVSAEKVPFTQWSGTAHTTDWLDYRDGCVGTDGTATMTQNFLQLTGATGASGSEPTLAPPVFLCAGMRFFSFRVRRDGNGVLNLEQKAGLFDPATDNPGNAFTPIMPDVEDFQVAYLYSQSPDGSGRTIFNAWDEATASAVGIPADGSIPTGSGGVPYQGTGSLWDVANVSGLRVSVTARSAPLRFESRKISVRRGNETLTNVRPRSEDRADAGPDDFEAPAATSGPRVGDFDHHRITSTVLIRNRMLGN